MSIFKNDESQWQRLDWTILRDSSASIYWRQNYLEEDIVWFDREGYRIVRFDCLSWGNDDFFHADLYKKLKLPDYYGSNFDALNECLRDLEIKETGLVIVLGHFDAWDRGKGQVLLEIIDRASRFHLLLGERIILLIQVDDPNTIFDPIKAASPIWNRREWFIKDRAVK
jgi:RNAse (barnase) inhibitor barstar